jgi:hypothetical protein
MPLNMHRLPQRVELGLYKDTRKRFFREPWGDKDLLAAQLCDFVGMKPCRSSSR